MYKKLLLFPMETGGGAGGELPDPDFGNDAIAESIFDNDSFKADKPKEDVKPVEEKTLEQTQQEESNKLNKIAEQNKEIENVQDETAKQIEAKKTAAKQAVQETKNEVETKVEDKKAQQVQVKTPRDYTGLDAKHVEFLKKQPNSVYDTLVPVLKENAKLKAEIEANKDPNRIPESYYENEQAITLTPEYRELNNLYNRLDTEGSFYQKQIIRVQNGQPYQELGWTKEKGYFIKTDGIAVPEDADAKAAILSELEDKKTYCVTEKMQTKAKADSFINDYKTKSASVKTHYKPLIEKHISSLPEQLRPKPEHIKEFENVIHPAHRGSSLVEVAASLYSLALNQGSIINAFLSEKNKDQQIKDDRKAAGPSNKVSLGSTERKQLDKNGKVAPTGVINFNQVIDEIEG